MQRLLDFLLVQPQSWKKLENIEDVAMESVKVFFSLHQVRHQALLDCRSVIQESVRVQKAGALEHASIESLTLMTWAEDVIKNG